MELGWGMFLSTTVVIIGWIATHYFNLSREIRSKQRETTVKFLIEAYQKLVFLSYDFKHGKQGEDEHLQRVGELQLVMLNIQLFGSSEQISLAKDVLNSISDKQHCEVSKLLDMLRNDLRKELQLDMATERLLFLS